MDDFDQLKKLKEQRLKIREEQKQQQQEDLNKLIDDSKTMECSDNIKTMLTPFKNWKQHIKAKPEWNELVTAYRKSRDVNFQLLGVIVISAFLSHKPAFLLSQSILNALLKRNKLIKRQTINGTEYGAFIAFAIKNGFLNIELEATGHRKARLFSLDGRLLNIYGIYAFNNPEQMIEGIKTDYIETENKKSKKPDIQEAATVSEVKVETTTAPNIQESDLAIVEKVMSLEHRFNDFEKETFPEIAKKVRRYGAFKGKQRKLCENFLKNKWDY